MSFLQLERRGLFIHLQSLQLLLKGVKEMEKRSNQSYQSNHTYSTTPKPSVRA